MKISKSYPPNYDTIWSVLTPDDTMIFCYGDTIYNPHNKEIPEDIQYHEHIHELQQKQYMSPEIWWTKYLYDRKFRLSQELEAFSEQYQLVKKVYSTRESDLCLDELAYNLMKCYALGINQYQAKTLIRKYAKGILQKNKKSF